MAARSRSGSLVQGKATQTALDTTGRQALQIGLVKWRLDALRRSGAELHMRIQWFTDAQDVERIKSFMERSQDDPFVQQRIECNLRSERPTVSKSKFWRGMVGCLLTTRQRSGPDSAVARFSELDPFPLAYEVCLAESDLHAFAHETLTAFGGLRFTNIIPERIMRNLRHLEAGLWVETFEMLDTLQENDTPASERHAAEFIDDQFVGFGPKQSRNLLQWLGLTKYEIPIDSRITRWLNKFGFPLKLSSNLLSNKAYYNLVSDGIQQLCTECGIYPTVFDAAVFASLDRGM
jgi:hypothetical protein